MERKTKTALAQLSGAFAGLFLLSSVTGNALADEEKTSGGWQLNTFAYQTDDETTGEGRVLFTQSTTANGALFYCKEGTLSVMVSLEPIAIHDVISDIGLAQAKRAELKIGDAEAFKENWSLVRRNKVAVPKNPYTGRKLFNAAANDTPITLSIGKYKNVVIDPPAAAADLFNEFVETCDLAG